jgi:hypothetical protein
MWPGSSTPGASNQLVGSLVAAFVSEQKSADQQRQASAIPPDGERRADRRADRRGHLLGRKSGSATCLLMAGGFYDRQAAGHCRFLAREYLDHQ